MPPSQHLGRHSIMPRILLPAALLLAVLLTACTQDSAVRDLEGRRIGELDWQPIAANKARLSITDDRARVLSRERVELHSRYMERWSLEGGHLVYEALVSGGFGAESKTPAYLHRLYGDDPGLKRQGVGFDANDVRIRQDLTFVVAHSKRVTCFVFVSVFGEASLAQSAGDQLLRGGICQPVQTGDPAGNDLDFIRILENLRVSGKPILRE